MSNATEKRVCARANEMVTCLYGEASATETAAFARHMDGCAECRTEFALMTSVRESMSQWRSEVLGLAWRAEPMTLTSPVAVTEAMRGRHLSALAALREFFAVSPLWLRGATAMVAVGFCLLAALFVARMLAPQEQLYTQEQVNDQVQREIAKSKNDAQHVAAISATGTGKETSPETGESGPASPIAGMHPRPKAAKAARGFLSREEREQLASDLRLKPTDEEDLTFLFEGGSD